MPESIDWMIVGDFNLMRKQEDRNKEEDLTEMFMFNDAISALGLTEIILQVKNILGQICNRTPYYRS
jgi:hypothetical protein